MTQEEKEITRIKQWVPNVIYDNYLDDGPTTIVQSGFGNLTAFELNRNYVFVDHEKHALCDSYIIEFVHDATESYYEKGKYGGKSFQVTKTPLFMMEVLKLHLFHLSMLVALCFNTLFYYKFLCIGSGLDLNVFYICLLMLCFSSLILMRASLKSSSLAKRH